MPTPTGWRVEIPPVVRFRPDNLRGTGSITFNNRIGPNTGSPPTNAVVRLTEFNRGLLVDTALGADITFSNLRTDREFIAICTRLSNPSENPVAIRGIFAS